MARDIVDFTELIAENFTKGVKVTGTVSGGSLELTDEVINENSAVDGPYIKDTVIGVKTTSFETVTDPVTEKASGKITYTLQDQTAAGKPAHIWVRN